MIIELLLMPLFALIKLIVGMLPEFTHLPDWVSSAASLIRTGLCFFPPGVWSIVIANISFWTFVHIAWAGIEWVYKKIPGVD